MNRDTKKRKKPFTLEEFTLTGLAKAGQERERRQKKENVWGRVDSIMKAFGGK